MKSHLQNGKESKLNYFCINEANKRISKIRNGIKKAEITYYSDTSPEWYQKVMSTSIAARMLQLLGLLTLLYQPGVRTNLEVTVLYKKVNVMGPLFVTAKLVIDH